jgi:CheY-like chemotaxis protein
MVKKILLADDSLTIQKVVELTFSDSGYQLICVSNGQKALDRIEEDRPDLVLADVVMPEKNGYEVCEAIKSNPATARIPVLLLSGTFEPFDRERAERIGADAIVSKPFDSQQLIAQVELLLDRGPSLQDRESPTGTTAPLPAAALAAAEADEAPFDVGFSAEDFTASVRIPTRGLDPFEEEYVRGDVDSAIEAFEKSRPQPASGEHAEEHAEEDLAPPGYHEEKDAGREAPPPWLRDEPERPAETEPSVLQQELSDEAREKSQSTLAVPMLASSAAIAADEAPTAEIPPETAVMPLPSTEEASAWPAQETESPADEAVFEIPPGPVEPREEEGAAQAAAATASEEVAREIEALAQKSSIPELTQMLSSVTKAGGNDWSDDQIEKLARRVVEKLSDRVVREIAWEVIPDMAEVVIKKRIKELEAGTE